MQGVGTCRGKGLGVERSLAGGAGLVVRVNVSLRSQGPEVRLVHGHLLRDPTPDVFAGPVGDCALVSHAVGVDDRSNDLPHVLLVAVVSVLQHQELPGHADVQRAPFDVLQDEVGQLQHAQVVGQALDGQAGLVDGAPVSPYHLDLSEALAGDVLAERHHGHLGVGGLAHVGHVHVDGRTPFAPVAQQLAGGHSSVAIGDLHAAVLHPAANRRLQEADATDAVGQQFQSLLVDCRPGLERVVVQQVQVNALSRCHVLILPVAYWPITNFLVPHTAQTAFVAFLPFLVVVRSMSRESVLVLHLTQ